MIQVYFHINPLKNEIFYVGIGSIKRSVSKKCRNKFWNNIVNKYGFIVDIIETDLTWVEACELEKFYIKKIGRRDLGLGPLVNLTDGGEGSVGRIWRQETLDILKKQKEFISKETIEKLSISRNKWKISDETKLKMSLSALNRPSRKDGYKKIKKNN
jgi:hypothetical protein